MRQAGAPREKFLFRAFALAVCTGAVASPAHASDAPPGSGGPSATDQGGVIIEPPAAPALGRDAGPPCAPDFAARLYRQARAKIVVVERPEGGLGAGFIFGSRRHVLTALHVVETSRYARVVLADGTAQAGEVVAVDPAHDVALLELEREQPEEPLLPRQHVEPGWPVVALGHPYGTLAEDDYRGVLKFSVSQGIVSAVNGDHLQTDTLIAPGNSGGPMLTCDGRVVAVSSQVLANRIGFGVPILYGVYLRGRARGPGFRGLPHVDDGAAGLFTQQEKTANYYGVFGGSAVVLGNLAFTTHLGLGLATRPDTVSPLASFTRVRGLFELGVGYRLSLFRYTKLPMSLTFAAGPTFYLDRGWTTEPALTYESPECTGQVAGPCRPALVARESTYKGGGVLLGPQVRVHLPQRILPLELSYAFQADVRSLPLSAHRVMVGLPF